MRGSNELGMVLLGLWLVLTGLFQLVSGVGGLATVLPLFELAAGAVLLLGASGTRTKNRNPGFLLLSIWLVVSGLLALLPTLTISGVGTILALLAIGAGVMLLVGARGRNLSRYPGMILLSIWLIITGVLTLSPLGVPGVGTIMALLALAAGVMLLLGR
jgi:hypothetical protein